MRLVAKGTAASNRPPRALCGLLRPPNFGRKDARRRTVGALDLWVPIARNKWIEILPSYQRRPDAPSVTQSDTVLLPAAGAMIGCSHGLGQDKDQPTIE